MKNFVIYSDGSHRKHTSGRLGCGGILVDERSGKEIDSFSTELLPSYVEMTFGTTDCSNPTAEMIGVLLSLYNFKKHIKPGDKVIICADYIGIREWMTGKWKIKEPYIQRIKDDIDSQINDLGLGKKNLEFRWVPGHQKSNSGTDAFWNNKVDKLAKGEKEDE